MEDRLCAQFEGKMKASTAPVFSDFDTYAKTLPRRLVGGAMKNTILTLYKLPFWADQQAVRTMALDFESNRRGLEGSRNYVRYATAPTAAGKTASILPAFLDSAEADRSIDGENVSFSYYIYLAFDNNDGRTFQAMSPMPKEFEKQGAFFILKCLAMYFDNQSGTVNISHECCCGDSDSAEPPNIHVVKSDLEALLDSMAPGGRRLIHVDEHHSMLSHENQSEAATFRRGALQTLAEIPGVVVVATYTKILTELDPAGSSKVCRYPVAVPLLDIDAMAESMPQFNMQLPERPLTATEGGLLSSVRFRLAQKISNMGLLSLHRAIRVEEMDKLRQEFEGVVESESNVRERLLQLHNVLPLDLSSMAKPIATGDALLLLCGVPEGDWNSNTVERQIRNVLLTSSGLVTVKLDTLLQMCDPERQVYVEGQSRFAQILEQSASLLSSTPLEAAYAWVISARSAKDGSLRFGRKTFSFRCEHLLGGRLFLKSIREDFAARRDELKQETLYYAVEGPSSGYKQDHPLGDLFFATAKGELVLIDVTASNDVEYKRFRPNKLPIATNRNRMIDWVKTHMARYNEVGISLHGIVLAPFDSGERSTITEIGTNSVSILRRTEAMDHLGGLSQFLFWFAPQRDVQVLEDGGIATN